LVIEAGIADGEAVGGFTLSLFESALASQHVGEGALATAVGAADNHCLALVDFHVDSFAKLELSIGHSIG
jgi:hypothetical protein